MPGFAPSEGSATRTFRWRKGQENQSQSKDRYLSADNAPKSPQTRQMTAVEHGSHWSYTFVYVYKDTTCEVRDKAKSTRRSNLFGNKLRKQVESTNPLVLSARLVLIYNRS